MSTETGHGDETYNTHTDRLSTEGDKVSDEVTEDGRRVIHLRYEDNIVTITTYYGDDDGLPVVQIDTTRNAKVRINVNHGELATVHEGGFISLPEHADEYDHSRVTTDRILYGTDADLTNRSQP